MGCGTSLNQSEVNQPKVTTSEPMVPTGKPDNQKQSENKQNKNSKKENIAGSLRQVRTQKSINFINQGNQHKIQEKVDSQQTLILNKRNPMDKLLLFGQSSNQRKIVHFLPMSPNPSFQILLSRSNNPPPIKYQPNQIILEQSQQLYQSHLYSSNSHPPYNFMYATFVDSDCAETYSSKNTINSGLVFLCGGVNFDFNHLSDQAFLYNPSLQNINQSVLNQGILPLGTPNKSPQSKKRRIGNNLMGSKFDRLPYMKTKRYSHMGVYYRVGKLKYIYIFGGRTQGDLTIKKCERYSFEERKWSQIAPMNMPRSTGFTLIINKKIYVFGGYTSQGKRSKKIERYNPAYDSWETLNYKLHRGIQTGIILPIPKVCNQIMLVGGNVEMGGLKSVIRLNFENQTYNWDSDLKKQRLLQKGLVIDEQNAAYIFGGDFEDTVEKYSFKDKSWKIMNNLSYNECISPDDINSFTMAQQTINLEYQSDAPKQIQQKNVLPQASYRYVFGCDDYPIIYEINTTKWVLKKKVVPMSLRLRSNMKIIKIKQGKYFIAGGIDSYNQKASRAAYIYYSLTNRAIQIAKMNQKKYDFGVCIDNEKDIYVFGGYHKNGSVQKILQSCQKYDIIQDKWIQLPNMPRQRRGCKALFTPDQNYIMLIGGTDSSEQGINQIDILSLDKLEWRTLKSIIPVPLQIKQIGILQGELAKNLISQYLKVQQKRENFEFLDEQQNKQSQQIKQQQLKTNDQGNLQQNVPLIIFNYNSYLKQYNIVKLCINLKKQLIIDLSHKQQSNQKLFPYNILFNSHDTNHMQKQYDVNESIEINSISLKKPIGKKTTSNQQIGILENTHHFLISNKGVFKWKYTPNTFSAPVPQIVINQIHLLSMPLQKFSIA